MVLHSAKYPLSKHTQSLERPTRLPQTFMSMATWSDWCHENVLRNLGEEASRRPCRWRPAQQTQKAFPCRCRPVDGGFCPTCVVWSSQQCGSAGVVWSVRCETDTKNAGDDVVSRGLLSRLVGLVKSSAGTNPRTWRGTLWSRTSSPLPASTWYRGPLYSGVAAVLNGHTHCIILVISVRFLVRGSWWTSGRDAHEAWKFNSSSRSREVHWSR